MTTEEKTSSSLLKRMLDKRNVLAFAVFLDLFSVSLIVPLIPIRFKELGVSPLLVGTLSSIYSASQIVGGLGLGLLGDRLDDRRTILLINFAGAALAYAMVGLASSIWFLAASRVVVGLVKQTMTASKAMAAEWAAADATGATSAADLMALVSSASMAAWLIGSTVTGTVRALHPLAPSVIAVGLYGIDALVVLFLLPPASRTAAAAAPGRGPGGKKSEDHDADKVATGRDEEEARKKLTKPGFLVSCKRAFGNGAVGRFLLIRIVYSLMYRSSMTMQDTWEMERFGLAAGELGYLRSVKSLISIGFQALIAGRAINRIGERGALLLSIGCFLVGSLSEAAVTRVAHYTAICVPVKLVGGLLGPTALDALTTKLVPRGDIGAALAVMDVLQSCMGVLAPLLGGAIIEFGGLTAKPLFSSGGFAGLLCLSLALLPTTAAAGSAPENSTAGTAAAASKKNQ